MELEQDLLLVRGKNEAMLVMLAMSVLNGDSDGLRLGLGLGLGGVRWRAIWGYNLGYWPYSMMQTHWDEMPVPRFPDQLIGIVVGIVLMGY